MRLQSPTADPGGEPQADKVPAYWQSITAAWQPTQGRSVMGDERLRRRFTSLAARRSIPPKRRDPGSRRLDVQHRGERHLDFEMCAYLLVDFGALMEARVPAVAFGVNRSLQYQNGSHTNGLRRLVATWAPGAPFTPGEADRYLKLLDRKAHRTVPRHYLRSPPS